MTNKPNNVRVSRELKCWSCKAVFTLSDHADCDGCCWKCGVEIDLHEMDIQPADQYPHGTRERFQKWVLSVEHPVKGWLDGHWLRRGDDREGYADEYVQGLWVTFKAFGAQPADQQGEPVAWQWRRKTERAGSLWTLWTDCSEADYEACIASPQPSVRGIIREVRRLYAQPATARVVLPARRQWNGLGNCADNLKAAAWNACLDEFAKLNGVQS
ncbi:hypothetical protein [Pseudomonas syringae]|uniref:hypothetical protein n=1 Tax=Pseudomonas syringae TaxID=317 RepID=UPI001F080330|nr:hypothetical protein [Pseudomonas syringae]